MALAPEHVRSEFGAGIQALHNFWYEEAERRFQLVQARAPSFSLGYWGEALAQHRNPFGHREPPVERMRAILAKLAPTRVERASLTGSEHERAYLEALEILVAEEGEPSTRHPAYAEAMGRLAKAYPDDLEALAFHARALLLEAPSFMSSPDVRERTAQVARRVLAVDSMHPGGLHYLIHAVDAPSLARGALPEARRYARVSQGASHAVHMPSHIYMQLGMWDEVVETNRHAVSVSRDWIHRTGRSPSDVDVHAQDFLIYGLLQQGRLSEARRILAEIRRLNDEYDLGRLRWFHALWHARFALATGQDLETPLPRSGYDSRDESFALGLVAVHRGDLNAAREYLAELEAGRERGVGWVVAATALRGAVVYAEGQGAQAVGLLRDAIALQEEVASPHETPDPPKPPEELMGEILLDMGRLKEAEEAFQAGDARWRGRLATRVGLARVAVARGDDDEARRRYRAVQEQLRLADREHPALREAREIAGTSQASRFFSPGDLDFSTSPLDDLEYEVRWISRPASPQADTGFVYMKVEEFLSEQRPAIRVEWRPFFGDLPLMDLIVLDPSTYAVRYRMEPRAGGGWGIYWYEDGRAFAAQVDSLGDAARAEMKLERPLFSVPTLPWVLAQISRRIENPVRVELPGFRPDQGGYLRRPLVRPGRKVKYLPPEGGGPIPGREMIVEFASGVTWTYTVSTSPPYFLSIVAQNSQGVLSSQIEVVNWAKPALTPSRRIPLVLRQSYMEGDN